MKISLACDHAAVELKDKVKEWLEENGYECVDHGSSAEKQMDYIDAAVEGCSSVISGECERAILICGTGIGISMAANKQDGIRAACCSDYYSAKYTRLHNDANALCFGARVVAYGLALELVKVFLETEAEGGRHAVRVGKIMALEK